MDDFLDGYGEGAYHIDKENERIDNETPEDLWEREFEEMDTEV